MLTVKINKIYLNFSSMAAACQLDNLVPLLFGTRKRTLPAVHIFNFVTVIH